MCGRLRSETKQELARGVIQQKFGRVVVGVAVEGVGIGYWVELEASKERPRIAQFTSRDWEK